MAEPRRRPGSPHTAAHPRADLMGLLLIAAVMANLPEEYIEHTLGVNRGALVACLGIAVIIGLFLYLKTGLFIAVVLLIAGANMPDQIAEGLNISKIPILLALVALVGVGLINYVVKLMPTGLERKPKEKSAEGPGALLRDREEQPGVRAEGARDELRRQPAPRQRLHPARLCRDARQRADDRAPAAKRRRPGRPPRTATARWRSRCASAMPRRPISSRKRRRAAQQSAEAAEAEAEAAVGA